MKSWNKFDGDGNELSRLEKLAFYYLLKIRQDYLSKLDGESD